MTADLRTDRLAMEPLGVASYDDGDLGYWRAVGR
jgi:hypothetical protein